MSKPSFVHLHLHTEYSMVDGTIRVKPLLSEVVKAGMPAVAVTDQSNLFALVQFYKSAQSSGIKPIVGVDLWIQEENPKTPPSRLLILCQNLVGYRNMTHLISRAYIEGQAQGMPMVHRTWFSGKSEGLIALSGGREGDIGRALLAGKKEEALRRLQFWNHTFPGRYYLELIRTKRDKEEEYLALAVAFAIEHKIPPVATNDVRFLKKEDFEVHEARVCIHNGSTLSDPRRARLYSEEQFLRSPEEMCSLFSDLPEALENSVQIARRCNLTLPLGKVFLPDFPLPKGENPDDYFRKLAQEGLLDRFRTTLKLDSPESTDQRRIYEERLEMEIQVIIQMKFTGYFLIVADFIRWAKEHGIPVGPGRGSGAGSIVAYALSITDLDPLPYGLLFERFLNPERVSMPDFDIDFCMERRDEVIHYVSNRYGKDRVSQIITYGTMSAKAVVRDSGRVLGQPYKAVDEIAKLIPFEVGITLDKAMEQEAILKNRYEQEEEVRVLLDLALKLEGLVKNAGKHAGGVVIAPSQLTDFAPLYCEPDGNSLVTQFDKDDIEEIGLIKFDFLGLKNLTIIDWAVKDIYHRENIKIDINTLPMGDSKTFELLQKVKTTAVFQLESRGIRELVRKLVPDCFEEIIALVALFRPGPLQSGMVDDFIERKHGRAKIEYPHPALEAILKPTYGVILYQEQVMQIAQVLAGYTLGGADLLRRAMGKKKPEEMAKQRSTFVDGATARGTDSELASRIFDLMEKFSGYGFNKSHSAAYAFISYQTAWLKANYPAEFMAAALSADMDNTDRVVALIEDCKNMGLTITPPSVDRSRFRFSVYDKKEIVYGLGAVRGVGDAAASEIFENRKQQSPFRNFLDFYKRVDLRRVNRKTVDSLIRAGALDCLHPSRATMIHNLDHVLRAAERHQQDVTLGQVGLFGETAVPTEAQMEPVEWDLLTKLENEKSVLGLYLSGHPIEECQDELSHFTTGKLKEIRANQERSVVVAGFVNSIRKTGRGVFSTIEDNTAQLDVFTSQELYEKYKSRIEMDRLVIMRGTATVDHFTEKLRLDADRVFDLDEAREFFAKSLTIFIKSNSSKVDTAQHLANLLTPFLGGECQIFVEYCNGPNFAQLKLGQHWRCRPHDKLLNHLRQSFGEIKVKYSR
ncbi:DNA polymerase III subunit alpha [Gammaproteobacteria bacterium]